MSLIHSKQDFVFYKIAGAGQGANDAAMVNGII
jgi:hypothetical protein